MEETTELPNNSAKRQEVLTVLGPGSISVNAIQSETVELQADDIKSIAKAQKIVLKSKAAKDKQHSKVKQNFDRGHFWRLPK